MLDERPKRKFNSRQTELIAVARMGLATYREKRTALAGFKAKYTDIWGNNLETRINATAAMPDFQVRNERAEILKVRMDKKNAEICEKWQGLKLYIDDVVEWKDVLKAKYEAAGWLYYSAAAKNNWDMTMAMVGTALHFMSTYATELQADDNMPATYSTEFSTLGTEFNTLFDQFEDANQDTEEDTDARLIKYNELYEILIAMFADGVHVFRHNAAARSRFIFAKVLELVRGASTPIKTFEVEANGKRKVERVVANSKVTNSGTVTLWVEAGAVETQGPSAVELAPEADMTTPGDTITVFNNETTIGEFEARVVVS